MKRYIIAVPLLAVLLASLAAAQDTPDLRDLGRDAGIIFRGTVLKIEPAPPAAAGQIGLLRVTFLVQDALRGATAGAKLTISEWDGLWIAGERYRVGEDLLLFLYPPSPGLGLTTTVGGMRGRISLAGSQLSMAAVAQQIGAGDSPPAPIHSRPVPTRDPRGGGRNRMVE